MSFIFQLILVCVCCHVFETMFILTLVSSKKNSNNNNYCRSIYVIPNGLHKIINRRKKCCLTRCKRTFCVRTCQVHCGERKKDGFSSQEYNFWIFSTSIAIRFACKSTYSFELLFQGGVIQYFRGFQTSLFI